MFATYNPYYSSGTHTAMKYDIMDRQTYVKPPAEPCHHHIV